MKQIGTWIKNAHLHPMLSPRRPPRGPPIAAPKALQGRSSVEKQARVGSKNSLDDVAQTLVQSTFSERNKIGRDDRTHRRQSSTSDSSECTSGDELRVGLGKSAGERAEEEDD